MNAETKPVALITGASGGVGRAIAVHLASMGYAVILHYYTDVEGVNTTTELVTQYHHEYMAVCADLTIESAFTYLRGLMHEYGYDKHIDLVVHTVGDFLSSTILETSIPDWKRMIDTNITSTLMLTQTILPMMQARKKGQFIFFGSALAQETQARPRTTLYTSAKAMLIALTQQLAHDHAREHISFSCISPTMLEGAQHPLKTPTQTPIMYEDVLRTIDFLIASPHTAINGTNITLSDGWLPGQQ